MLEGLQKDGYNPNEGFDNPNIQKETHKAMYGPEGNTQGSAAFMTAAGITNLLKSSGVPLKGKPFEYFFFLIKDVFMGKDAVAAEKNINKFSLQMEKLSSYFTAWESIKKQVYLAGSGHDTTDAFRASIGKFLNLILGPMGGYFPTDGSPISIPEFEDIHSELKSMTPKELESLFPALGPNILIVINTLQMFIAYFGAYKQQGIKPLSLAQLWNRMHNGGVAVPGGGHMPDATAFTNFFDALSEGSSTLSGISQSNSSKLSYAQNQYNRLFAFVHSMLKSWLEIRKGMEVKMSQARN
ncbi:MAG: hypothetical protein P0S95_02135 [Rhabdochlamydiaceae bacterium]|nr:hypothetical protein [Candidatus Amphrikana amoebophyrae]